MEIRLDVRKSVEENAAAYFEASKKAKKKIEGAQAAVEKVKLQLQSLLDKQRLETEDKGTDEIKRERKWFEKFRWFISSEGFLCVGGRDATTNEIVVKKHAEKGDIVFHTEMSGSPFFVVKAEGKEVGKETLEEVATATASFSRAWKLKLSNAEVFYVNPAQLSKTPKAGEYLEKGAFVVSGKATKMVAEIKLAVGVTEDNAVMCGPVSAVKKNCGKYIVIMPGDIKSSDIARKVKKTLGGEIDDIVRVLPSGGCRIAANA